MNFQSFNVIYIYIRVLTIDFSAKKVSAVEKQLKEEEKILESVAEKKALMAVGELAKGIQYDKSIKTSWRPPKYFRKYCPEYFDEIRNNLRISVEGNDVPIPIQSFKAMKLHKGNNFENW